MAGGQALGMVLVGCLVPSYLTRERNGGLWSIIETFDSVGYSVVGSSANGTSLKTTLSAKSSSDWFLLEVSWPKDDIFRKTWEKTKAAIEWISEDI